MDDGHRAVTLAEWTARKDFLEYCRENDYSTPSCERASNLSLGPPPRFFARSLSECGFDLLDRDALLSSLRDEIEGTFSWEHVGPGCGWRWMVLDVDGEGVWANCSGEHVGERSFEEVWVGG
ncbi:hypothetical protein C8A05DRAFT_30506 [Staphylotrichum tortipilum]|uniref:Uncharacterized protein n=1 Tax=Staphylotrichum tortipilum TaxID=2831512 RepID=A0AAN6RWM1_9PEZI|nr:hypothetical protein C8A05DRAFT_30506 [Staphylotrichum longicolle]